MTVRVERSIHLPVPPDDAWAVLVAWERQGAWMLDADRVAVVSDRREGVGVRLAARTRVLGVFVFTEPMSSGDVVGRSAHKAAERAWASIGSPTAVPVPCASTNPIRDGAIPA